MIREPTLTTMITVNLFGWLVGISNLIRKSTMGTIVPRRFIIPLMHAGMLGIGVTRVKFLIS